MCPHHRYTDIAPNPDLGVGRDYPPIELNNWPDKHPWAVNDSSDAVPRRSYETLLRSVAKYPLINEPYLYPIYSNSGFDLLGLVNVAANRKASDNPDAEPSSHRELVQRDIFNPIGLNSSFYRVPSDLLLSSRIAVPSQNADWAVRFNVSTVSFFSHSNTSRTMHSMTQMIQPEGSIAPLLTSLTL